MTLVAGVKLTVFIAIALFMALLAAGFIVIELAYLLPLLLVLAIIARFVLPPIPGFENRASGRNANKPSDA